RECKQLLDKEPDIVTPNGFEPNFVPDGKEYDRKRAEAREALINVAEKLLGCSIDPDALLVSTSGRYEYRNKGIDVFIEAMNRVRTSRRLRREVVAFIMVPAWVRAPRADLKEAVEKDIEISSPMQLPFITHWLHNMREDKILNYINFAGFTNSQSEKLKIIFVPCYLDGKDGIFNKTYYDMLIGMDATVYPSYYEPWGYTPLESVAFGIP
ncbi:starch synthase, partial [gut metagenome]